MERIHEKQPEDIPAITNGEKTVNAVAKEIRQRDCRFAIVDQRANEVVSAIGRLRRAIEKDLTDEVTFAEVQNLFSVCNAMEDMANNARLAIERMKGQN